MTDNRVFNWRPEFDERSRNFPISAVVPQGIRKNKLWRVGPILDQGQEGACVGFGWTAEVLATPVAVDLNKVKAAVPHDPTAFAQYVYHTAKTLDEWPGENYDGTSVLAGAKAIVGAGFMKEYRWAFGIDDVIDAIIHKGPVVLGIEWHDGMYEAPNGVLKVSGPVVGGHCIAAVGYRTAESAKAGVESVILQNSWGPNWGDHGLAEISKDDLAGLLSKNGEACVPSKRSYGR